MPGPTQNSAPVDLERVLKELSLVNQRISAMTKMLNELKQTVGAIPNVRVVHAETLRPANARPATVDGAKAHE